MEILKLFESLNTYKAARDHVDNLVNTKYPQGLLLRWTQGKYAGRECVIRSVYWDDFNGDPRILLNVATAKVDNKGFLDDNDRFHRRCHSLNNFEIVKSLEY